MKIFGFAGWSGSGKTTLMVELLSHLAALGVRVSTIKHAHHGFEIDTPGKDSYRHRQAGATEVMVASATQWALIHGLGQEPEPSLEHLISRMSPVDLLLIEGFKAYHHDKMEVHRPSLGKPMLWPQDPHIVAVASDAPIDGLPLPRFDLADPQAVAAFILARTGLAR